MSNFTLERDGAGTPAVFLHGFCQSSAYWEPTADRLAAAGVPCLAPDLPGFGASAGEPGPYTMAALADSVARLLDARGLSRVTLIGGSMGGVVAQQFVLRYPERVSRLLLVATGAMAADPAAALAKADVMAAAPWDETAIEPIVNGFFLRPPSAPDLAKFRSIALSATQAAAIDAARSNALNNTLDQLSSIRVPTLIVQGRHDRARTPEHGAEMQARIAGAALAVIEDAGHTPQLEQPDAFHDVALPFLLAARVAQPVADRSAS
ncbi:alpha/beta hydrolase [Paraburkholderia fungorum]|uniref:alpha/beta fold hydrolase n=1 Tax=Paraburkholderia fungorum TaxID=134537 RepID=UPI0038B80D00